MRVSAIVACDQNRLIGLDNQIPWHLSGDLRFFKKTTLNHHILMGRKSFMSIGRPLPKRTNIVITRDPFFVASGCQIVHSIEEGLQLAQEQGEEEAFIIGGAQIYQQSEPYWDRLYLTRVDADIHYSDPSEAVYFPDIDFKNWILTDQKACPADDKNEYPYTICLYDRITPV